MPLHDWNTLTLWPEAHQVWVVELYYQLNRTLPARFFPSLGRPGALAVRPPTQPDVLVNRDPAAERPELPRFDDGAAPDSAGVATLEAFDTARASTVVVSDRERVVAIVELISPRNKDRIGEREELADRFARLLVEGVSVVLVDVHPRPYEFSFPDAVAARLGFTQLATPAPAAVAWHSDGPLGLGGGLPLSFWRRPMTVGQALPTVPLPLPDRRFVALDLESGYSAALGNLLARRPG